MSFLEHVSGLPLNLDLPDLNPLRPQINFCFILQPQLFLVQHYMVSEMESKVMCLSSGTTTDLSKVTARVHSALSSPWWSQIILVNLLRLNLLPRSRLRFILSVLYCQLLSVGFNVSIWWVITLLSLCQILFCKMGSSCFKGTTTESHLLEFLLGLCLKIMGPQPTNFFLTGLCLPRMKYS